MNLYSENQIRMLMNLSAVSELLKMLKEPRIEDKEKLKRIETKIDEIIADPVTDTERIKKYILTGDTIALIKKMKKKYEIKKAKKYWKNERF